MNFYPINLDIDGKPCVVIGGGQVALRKIRGLLMAGAKVKVITPEVCVEVEELARRGEISLIRKDFAEELLDDELILIAATDNEQVNQRAAEAGGSLINVVEGSGGNFNVPSTIRRGELLLTISTGAKSPAFSKFVRQMLEAELSEDFGEGLEIISRYRRELKQLLPNHKQRKIFWEKFLTREVWELLKRGSLEELETSLKEAIGKAQ